MALPCPSVPACNLNLKNNNPNHLYKFSVKVYELRDDVLTNNYLHPIHSIYALLYVYNFHNGIINKVMQSKLKYLQCNMKCINVNLPCRPTNVQYDIDKTKIYIPVPNNSN